MATMIRSGGPSGNFVKVVVGSRKSAYKPVHIHERVHLPHEHISAPLTSGRMITSIIGSAAILRRKVVTGSPAAINVVQRRLSHTDVVFPNFDEYKKESTLDPTRRQRDTLNSRRTLQQAVIYGGSGALMLVMGKAMIRMFISVKGICPEQMALASIEVDISEIPVGVSKTYEWLGNPVFVKHRSAKDVERERQVTVSDLRDPQTDDERVQKSEWLVVIGVCTHLGCVPIAGQGNYPGGYYCPCHGSHYDGSGRIRRGPAPLNLAVPKYWFKDENTLIVGEEAPK